MILKSSLQIAFGHGVKNNNRKQTKTRPSSSVIRVPAQRPFPRRRAHEQARHPSAMGVEGLSSGAGELAGGALSRPQSAEARPGNALGLWVTQGARGKQPGPRVATDKGGGALCACTAGSGASLGSAARAQRVRVTPEGACAVSPARRQDAARRAAGKQLPDR